MIASGRRVRTIVPEPDPAEHSPHAERTERHGDRHEEIAVRTVSRSFARIATAVLIAGAVAGSTGTAFADTPATDAPVTDNAVRTVAVTTPLKADDGNPAFQNGIRKGTQDGSKDGFADAQRNCEKNPKPAVKKQGFAPSTFDEGYAQGYPIGYEKGFGSAERQFCTKGAGGKEETPAEGPKKLAGVFEATGADPKADNVVTDRPGDTTNEFDVALPFRKDFTAPADADLLQVVVTGRGQVNCKITFGGKVVATDSGQFSAHCVFQK
jgi:hypothetical protein